MSDRELLLVALGPVQDFIATARRCQDLWFGSQLLSELSRVAAETVRSKGGVPVEDTLIFPPNVDQRDMAVANKILARVPIGQGRAIAEATQKAVQGHLMERAEAIFDEEIPSRAEGPRGFDREAALSHLKDLIEFFWVAVPEGGSYPTARAQAEGLLARRKLSRDWPQAAFNDTGWVKSSLDGARPSVIHEDAYDDKSPNRLTPDELYEWFKIKGKERLCGVALLKRLGFLEEEGGQDQDGEAERPVFHSTSHVAALPVLTRLASGPQGVLGDYIQALRQVAHIDVIRLRIRALGSKRVTVSHPFDGELSREVPRAVYAGGKGPYDAVIFFKESVKSLIDEAPAKALPTDKEKRLAEIKLRNAAVDKAFALIPKAGLPAEPCPYYAYLLADGDHMGVALDEIKGFQAHRKISKALEAFARSAREVVADHSGSLIYAGGDDVLALLPLHTALACARALRDRFNKAIHPVIEQLGGPKDGPPTLSVGLGIAHHLDSMTQARELAKRAEKLAKVQRNSLAIVVDKRSGGVTEATRAWSDDANALDRSIVTWARLLEAEHLPHKAAFELEDVPRVFEQLGANGTPRVSLAERNAVLVTLAERVLHRRKSQRGDEAFNDQALGTLKDRLQLIKDDEAGDARDGIRQLAHEIQIARLFLHAWRDAWGDELMPRTPSPREADQ